MTLQEIKDEYARETGHQNWQDLTTKLVLAISLMVHPRNAFDLIESHLDEVMKRYATACIKADRQRLANLSQDMRYFIDGPDTDNVDILGMKHRRQQDCYAVPKQTILNTPIELI